MTDPDNRYDFVIIVNKVDNAVIAFSYAPEF
jgi:hypothetical protein